mmetsp:Transcript_8011/g.12156  ORF Transcript_8011/g.12156 Transcript_8011/m.12156 type:complete len:88 (-) Transcript_8011:697-960(-)
MVYKNIRAEFMSSGPTMTSIKFRDYFNMEFKKNPGVFNLKEYKHQKRDMDLLNKHEIMKHYMPASERGGLTPPLVRNPTQYGPFTFG